MAIFYLSLTTDRSLLSTMESTMNKTPSQGNYDPGWNDPPTFSYTRQASANKPRNLLNKRVAFPLSPNSNASPIAQNVNLPPPVAPYVPSMVLPPKTIPNIENPTETNLPTVEDIKRILEEIIDSCPELGERVEDIKKRVGIMEAMWKEEKLNSDIKIKMMKLCEALKNGQAGEADEIHKSLMVDHVTLVSSWMIGIKKLIFHLIAKNDLLKIDQES